MITQIILSREVLCGYITSLKRRDKTVYIQHVAALRAGGPGSSTCVLLAAAPPDASRGNVGSRRLAQLVSFSLEIPALAVG